MIVPDASCIAIWGRRRAGKTTRLLRLIGQHRRVVVFDVVGQFAGRRDFTRCDTLGEVRDRLKAGRATGFRLAYVPEGDPPRMLHGLAQLVWAFQFPFAEGRDRRRLLFAIEEAAEGYPAQKLPKAYTGMGRVIRLGAHRGIDMIAVAQRPTEVAATLRGNCSEQYILPLAEEIDYARMLKAVGRKNETALRSLSPLQWLHVKDGKVSIGRDRFK